MAVMIVGVQDGNFIGFILLIGLCVSLAKALRAEPLPEPEPRAAVRLPEPPAARLSERAAPQPGAASGS